MAAVRYPLVIYSYYNRVGNPGARTTPQTVAAWNARPPNPLTGPARPSWSDIAIENVTASDVGGASIIWGLPLADGLVERVRFDGVRLAGGPGLEIYDAADVQFLGRTAVAAVTVYNALAILDQPRAATVAAGSDVGFAVRVAGASGLRGTPPQVRWICNGVAVRDGRRADGAVVVGAATAALRIAHAGAAEAGAYAATVTATLDGFDVAAGALAPDAIPVSATSAPAVLTVD
jgi:hypothetical protein